MENISDLISPFDFLLLLLYAIFSFLLLRGLIFRNLDPKVKRLFVVFYVFKVFCALLMSLLLVYYWGMSDNTSFFAEGVNLTRLVREDITNIKYFFLPVDTYNERIKFDNELTATASSLGNEGNFFAAKVSAILYPLSLGKYLIVNFFFSIIAAVGQFKFFMAMAERYPYIKKNVAVAVLFMPSVLLYSSYLNKETLCMAFMGFAIYHFFALVKKRNLLVHGTLLLLNIFFIGLIKIYILAAFFSAALIVYLVSVIGTVWRGSVFSKIFISLSVAAMLWVFFANLSFFDSYMVDFAEASNTFQEQYSSFSETSSFEFGEVETSFAGVLKKAPLGIYTTYFRPQLWEANKAIILFSALEAFFVLVLTVLAVIGRRKNIVPLFKSDPFAKVSFFYVLIFGVIVGLTTFNFGSLVRYKIPAVPFLMLFIFLVLHYRHPNKPGMVIKVKTAA